MAQRNANCCKVYNTEEQHYPNVTLAGNVPIFRLDYTIILIQLTPRQSKTTKPRRGANMITKKYPMSPTPSGRNPWLCLPVCLPVCMSVCMFVCLTLCLFVCLSVCLSVLNKQDCPHLLKVGRPGVSHLGGQPDIRQSEACAQERTNAQ